MKKLILALLLFATPTFGAVRAGLIYPYIPPTSNNNGMRYAVGYWQQLLENFGCYYDGIPQADATNTVITTGARALTNTLTINYGAMIHLDFLRNVAANRHPNYNPDVLGTVAGWPSIPSLVVGVTSGLGGSIFTSAVACTTGYTGTLTIATPRDYRLFKNLAGSTEVWYSGNSYYYNNNGTNTFTRLVGATGFTEPIINLATNAIATRDSGRANCTWCDSIGFSPGGLRSSTSTIADTSVLIGRYRTPTDPDPVFWMLADDLSNGSVTQPLPDYAIALGRLDRACGGQLAGQKPGWQPMTVALVVKGIGSRSTSSYGTGASQNYDTHAMRCSAVCDSPLTKAYIDSLKTLKDWKGIPVPITGGVNPDSIKPYEKSWWRGMPNFEVFPDMGTGSGTSITNVNMGNASRYLMVDPFGRRRTRTYITPDRLTNGTPCDGTDTTISCNVQYARDRLDSIPEFNGKVSKGIIAPHHDYFAANCSRTNLPTPDSVEASLYRSGVRVAVTDVMKLESNPGESWGLQAGGTNNLATGEVLCFNSYPRKHLFKYGINATGNLGGKFTWGACRIIDEDIDFNVFSTHQIQVETAVGIFGQPWYSADLPYWYHNLKGRLNVVEVGVGDLGFTTSTGYQIAPGYWYLKNTVSYINAINKSFGREMIKLVFLGDL